MNENEVKTSMQKALEVLVSDISSIRTGRASSSIIENIVVKAYGGAQHLKILELASITIPDPQMILIEPWDKSVIGEIKQAILGANVGLNPSIDSEKIRIVVPPMTTEDREHFVKLLNTKIENGRVAIRQVRADAMHDIKKAFEAKEITEDDNFQEEKKLQELTDEFIKKVEELGEKKTQELRTL